MSNFVTIQPKLMVDKELLTDQFETLETLRRHHEQRGHTKKAEHLEGVASLIEEIFLAIDNQERLSNHG